MIASCLFHLAAMPSTLLGKERVDLGIHLHPPSADQEQHYFPSVLSVGGGVLERVAGDTVSTLVKDDKQVSYMHMHHSS